MIPVMPKRDARVDAYIAKSPDFAKPILQHFRGIVDEACPDAEETIRWGTPSWQYAGALLCSMAAFKQHCTYNFWKAQLLTFRGNPVGFGRNAQFGHITSMRDLPARSSLVKLVKQAATLNADGVKESVMTAAGPRQARKALPVPADLKRALATHKKARIAFEGFSPSHRREYIEWITEAKRDDTRAQRLATTLEWLAEGKPRNWKYMSKQRPG
jgi:uncharacterized protein YdeI (YjbR/CyaY-like superfamily)